MEGMCREWWFRYKGTPESPREWWFRCKESLISDLDGTTWSKEEVAEERARLEKARAEDWNPTWEELDQGSLPQSYD